MENSLLSEYKYGEQDSPATYQHQFSLCRTDNISNSLNFVRTMLVGSIEVFHNFIVRFDYKFTTNAEIEIK